MEKLFSCCFCNRARVMFYKVGKVRLEFLKDTSSLWLRVVLTFQPLDKPVLNYSTYEMQVGGLLRYLIIIARDSHLLRNIFIHQFTPKLIFVNTYIMYLHFDFGKYICNYKTVPKISGSLPFTVRPIINLTY